MTEKKYSLPKIERLSLKRYQDRLFAEGKSFVAYPLRVVYLCTDEAMPARSAMLVSVPKKKFRRAVKRNRVKRLVREAYRLRKPELHALLAGNGCCLLVAFIYLDSELPAFAAMEKAMLKTVRVLSGKLPAGRPARLGACETDAVVPAGSTEASSGAGMGVTTKEE